MQFTKNLKHYLQLLDFTDLMISKLNLNQIEFINSLDCDKQDIPLLFNVWQSMQNKAKEFTQTKYKALLEAKGLQAKQDKQNKAFLLSEMSKLNRISNIITDTTGNLSTDNIF